MACLRRRCVELKVACSVNKDLCERLCQRYRDVCVPSLSIVTSRKENPCYQLSLRYGRREMRLDELLIAS